LSALWWYDTLQIKSVIVVRGRLVRLLGKEAGVHNRLADGANFEDPGLSGPDALDTHRQQGTKMRLTTKGRYGVRAVVNLAATGHDRPVSISQIAGEEDLSPEFLEQIFFKLKNAGLIRSVRGPKGGFVLNRDPSEITVKSILDAVGEPLNPTPCADGQVPPCPRIEDCSVAPVWQSFYDTMERFLDGVSLQDILSGRAAGETVGLTG